MIKFRTLIVAVVLMATVMSTAVFAAREDAVPLTLEVLKGPAALYAILVVIAFVFAVIIHKLLNTRGK